MSDLKEKKKQPPRYPMGTPKQVKGTLARLTRDLLSKKIDVQTYRAAAYGLSVQAQLFKYEMPEHKEVDIKIGEPNWIMQMSQEERNKKLDELMRKSMPFYDDYLKFANGKASDISKLDGNNYLEIDNALYWEDSLASVDEYNQGEKSLLFNMARRQKEARESRKSMQPVESDTMSFSSEIETAQSEPPVETLENQPAEAKAKLEDTGAKWPDKEPAPPPPEPWKPKGIGVRR